jgi:hypothetical protein
MTNALVSTELQPCCILPTPNKTVPTHPFAPPPPPPQNWIPTFLATTGGSGQGIAVTGGLSSIPWVAAAAVGPLAGQWASRLIRDKVLSQLAVRRLMQVGDKTAPWHTSCCTTEIEML